MRSSAAAAFALVVAFALTTAKAGGGAEGAESCGADGSSAECHSHVEELAESSLLQARLEPRAAKQRPPILTVYDEKYRDNFEQWKACAKWALGVAGYNARVQAVQFSEEDSSENSSETSLLQIAPKKMQFLLPRLLREGLAKGGDLMKSDVDAYLWTDPAEAFSEAHPEADIVASTDCANGLGNCKWYLGEEFLKRHGGKDPLAEVGFMLNLGLILFRSNPRVLSVLDEYIAARKAVGVTWGDQTLLNEVLLQWNCAWTLKDGSPTGTGGERFTLLYEKGTSVHGTCKGGTGKYTGQKLGPLRIVMMPYSIVGRKVEIVPGSVAMHPGGAKGAKERARALAKATCV